MVDPRPRHADDDGSPARDPRPLEEVIGRVLKRMKVSDRGVAVSVFSRWRSIVGDTVADHVTPKRLEKRRLVVEVDDPAWATQLRFLESKVLSTLREHIGDEVDALDIRVRRS